MPAGDAPDEAPARVERWVRRRFALAPRETVLVAEVSGTLPGVPKRQTLVLFWTDGRDRRHHLKIFKPPHEVVEDDLPPAWMKDALVLPPGADCNCC